MPILIKTGPLKPDAAAGAVVAFKEKAYREPVFGAQDHAFIWVDGSGTGGKDSNLFAEGMVVGEPRFEDPGRSDSAIYVKVVLTRLHPKAPLNYMTDIRPHRDDPSDRLLHGLAEVICKHAHRKVTALTPAQAAFLRSRFDS